MTDAAPHAGPLRVVRVDLDAPQLPSMAVNDGPYVGALVIAFRSGSPVGQVELPIGDRRLQPAVLRTELAAIPPRRPPGPPCPADTLPTVTVAIATTFERVALLRRCLATLAAQDYPSFDVIVVDNRPDGTAHRAELWRSFSVDPRVRVLAQPHPGVSAARNLAVAAAQSEIIVFTDDDVEVEPGWLRAIGSRFAREPRTDCITGPVLPTQLETTAQVWFERAGGHLARSFTATHFDGDQAWRRRWLGRWRPSRYRVIARHEDGTTETFQAFRAGRIGVGASLAVRIRALAAIGGFDEALGPGTPTMGGGDHLLLITLLQNQRRVTFDPDAYVFHTHGVTFDELRREMYGYGVGYSAMLAALARRGHRIGLLWHLGQAVYLLPRKLVRRRAPGEPAFPRELSAAEFRGLLAGPIAYRRSLRLHRRRMIADRLGSAAGNGARIKDLAAVAATPGAPATVPAPRVPVREPLMAPNGSAPDTGPAPAAAAGSPGRTAARARPSGLVANALALMTSTVGSGALGLAFWVVAAHLFRADQVGRVSAEVASVTLVASLGQIVLTSVFARFLPVARRRTGMIVRRGYAATLIVSWLLACGFVALHIGGRFLPRGTATIVGFILCVLIFAVFALQDVVLTALRRAPWVLVENILVALARLALLGLVISSHGRIGVLTAWAAPMLVAVIAVNWLVFRRLVPARQQLGDDSHRLPGRRQLARFGAAQFIDGLITNMGTMVPPVLIAARLGPTAGAIFYFPWLICTTCNALLWNIVFSLVVEAMHDVDRTRQMLRRAALMGMLVTCGGAVVFGFGAPLVLGLVGSAYRSSGTIVLQLIALSLPFVGIRSLYWALAVIERRTWLTTVLDAVGTLVIFIGGGTLLVSRLGLAAFGLSFLVAQVMTALVAGPGILRRYERLAMLDKTVVLARQGADMTDTNTQMIYPFALARAASGQSASSLAETLQFTIPRDSGQRQYHSSHPS